MGNDAEMGGFEDWTSLFCPHCGQDFLDQPEEIGQFHCAACGAICEIKEADVWPHSLYVAEGKDEPTD